MILARALRLAAANRELRDMNRRLFEALCIANATNQRVARRCALLERDIALVALMASDRETALAFIRDAHDIDQLPEGTT